MPGWEELERLCQQCRRCSLYKSRKNLVFGTGNKNADLMFIGEGPGREEDETGIPFVGRSGRLLNKILEAVEIKREDVYIANIVKCRPPGNRNPLEEEKEACLPFLRYQVALVRPRIIVCLGSVAARSIIDKDYRITKDHGKWIERKGYYLTATYHPSALLRVPARKKEAWEDFKKIKEKLVEPCPG